MRAMLARAERRAGREIGTRGAGGGLARSVLALLVLAVARAGAVLAWQAGRERARLAAHSDRLVAAAGELPADDPTWLCLKALDTGDPLHFAWRVHLPAKTN